MKPTVKVVLILLVCLESVLFTHAERLRLPPGLQQTLPLAKSGSYFADAINVQDCPKDEDNPNGLCNNVLFGGLAMFVSHLSGTLQINFQPAVGNLAKFEIRHPSGLRGDDALQRAPQLYQFPVNGLMLTDTAEPIRGELDLETGEVSNLQYRMVVNGNLYREYRRLNPQLSSSVISFPGSYGSTILTRERHSTLIRFTQRADGLLDFTFFASNFIPLGNNQGGRGDDKIRIPLPFCTQGEGCLAIQAPGTSLHPQLRISTKGPDGEACGTECPEFPSNAIRVFTATGYYTSTGDEFHLAIPELGGDTEGRSHLQGRLVIQFGDRYGDSMPVAVRAVLAEGLMAEPPPAPIPGFGLNMLGFNEKLRFPNYTYQPKDVAFSGDPFDLAVGVLNLKTGKFIGDLMFRGFPAQDLLFAVQAVNAGRIPPDSFRYQGPASFERGPNRSLIFRYDAGVFLNFETLNFPDPTYNPNLGWPVGPGAELNPFLKIQATASAAPAPVVKSGSLAETSSFGDPIRIEYAIPCNVDNPSFSFLYTNSVNDARGGTFRMHTLASTTCTNSRGNPDVQDNANVVTFTGFGSWSKDSGLHLATVQVSTNPNYWAVQIDGGLLSNANSKPAVRPAP
jgi:hypothetical protein